MPQAAKDSAGYLALRAGKCRFADIALRCGPLDLSGVNLAPIGADRLSITHNLGLSRWATHWGNLESKESLVIHC